jgi:trehalose/maltose hydrolase-like predicted phosphorylase
MAGSVDLALRVATGLEIRDDILHLDPSMPAGLHRLDMRIRYRGFTLDLRLAPRSLTVRARQAGADPIRIAFRGAPAVAFSGGSRTFEY